VSRAGQPLWSGRFAEPPAPEAAALGRSLAFDVRLAPQDVEVSVAHVRGLEDAGLLSSEDAEALERTLREVGAEIATGTCVFDEADEDVHSAIERGVTDRLGDLGGRLHAGRSRNDLVATDLRLWLLAARDRIDEELARLVWALVARAREHAGTPMPASTHGRAAQPVTLGHALLAHAWPLLRDRERLAEWGRRAAVSPLGAGAIATSTLPLDPAAAAERLGFPRAFENSIDAVSDRDFVQEFLAVAAILGTHMSRLAADLIRASDEALGWASLSDAYSTGSSMMPHKRNPDVAELARAKAGRLIGDFAALSSVLVGLPLGYHRDLQEDKERAFDAVDTILAVLPGLAGCIETMTFDEERLCAAASVPSLFATDVAEDLVQRGVPFREAHRRVGELLKQLDSEGRTLADLSEEAWAELGVPDGRDLLDPVRSVEARTAPGGPSPASVERQAERIERMLSE